MNVDSKLKEFILQFYSLSDEACQLLTADMRLREYKKGDVLMESGKVDTSMYIPYEGLFRVFYLDAKGNERTELFSTPGNPYISCHSYFRGEPAFYQVEAITPQASAYCLSKKILEHLCSVNLEIANWVRMVCLDELYCLERKSDIFGRYEATERYKNLIKIRPELIREIPLKYIASYMGITQQSLSRLRSQVHKRG